MKISKLVLLMDLDGVVALWTKSVCKIFNVDYENLIKNWTPGNYETATQLVISEDEMWQEINKHNTFWEDIEVCPYAHDMVDYLQSKYEVHVCTSPSKNPECVSGKLRWLNQHFNFGRNFVLTPQKWLCAGPNKVLIDDLDKNCDKFREHGGHAFLFSQVWNSDYANVDTRMERLIKFLEGLENQ